MKTAIALLLLLFGLLPQAPAEAELKQMVDVRRDFEKESARNPERARTRYVSRLAALLARFVGNDLNVSSRRHEGEYAVVAEELRKHPAPPDSDGAKFAALRVGRWASPRHEYEYREDGTWSMLPEDESGPGGLWRVAGNRIMTTSSAEPRRTARYTVIHLDRRYFVFMDDDGSVFFEARTGDVEEERGGGDGRDKHGLGRK